MTGWCVSDNSAAAGQVLCRLQWDSPKLMISCAPNTPHLDSASAYLPLYLLRRPSGGPPSAARYLPCSRQTQQSHAGVAVTTADSNAREATPGRTALAVLPSQPAEQYAAQPTTHKPCRRINTKGCALKPQSHREQPHCQWAVSQQRHTLQVAHLSQGDVKSAARQTGAREGGAQQGQAQHVALSLQTGSQDQGQG